MKKYKKTLLFCSIIFAGFSHHALTAEEDNLFDITVPPAVAIKLAIAVTDSKGIVYAATQPKSIATKTWVPFLTTSEMTNLQTQATRKAPKGTSLYTALIWQPDGISAHNKDTWFMFPGFWLSWWYDVDFTPYNISTERTGPGIPGTKSTYTITGSNGSWIDSWRNDTPEAFRAKLKDLYADIKLIKTAYFMRQLFPQGNYLQSCQYDCTYNAQEQKLSCNMCVKTLGGVFPTVELKPVKLTDTVNFNPLTGKLSIAQK